MVAWSALRSGMFHRSCKSRTRRTRVIAMASSLLQKRRYARSCLPNPNHSDCRWAITALGARERAETAHPMDVWLPGSVTSLLRHGYIEQIAKLIGPTWRSMSEEQLTAYLSKHYTEKQVEAMFLQASAGRTAIKTHIRRASVVGAFVVGLIWAGTTLPRVSGGRRSVKVARRPLPRGWSPACCTPATPRRQR